MVGQIIIDQREQLILYKKELMIAKRTQAELNWRKMMDRWQQNMSQLNLLHDKWNAIVNYLEGAEKSLQKEQLERENSNELRQAEVKLKNMVTSWKSANRKWKQTARKRRLALTQWDQVIDEYGMVIYKKNQTVSDLDQTINHLEKVTNDWEKSRDEELFALKKLEQAIDTWQQTIKKLELVINVNKRIKKLRKKPKMKLIKK